MATNNFKAFAIDPNANVTPQTNWEALPALLSGFTAGKASSAQVNKALRQATTIAALVGQFIANSGVDALDNADVNGLVTKFTDALTTNLNLGTAATKNVGTGAGQIPDMSSFSFTKSNPLNFSLPGGLILKAGNGTLTTQSQVYIGFPTAFPNACIAGGPLSAEEATNDYVFAQGAGRSAGGLTIAFYRNGTGQPPQANTQALSYTWFAIGY